MARQLRFKPVEAPGVPGVQTALAANYGKWQFLILYGIGYGWTVSRRLRNPKGPTSGSSTVRGPMDSKPEALGEAETMLDELREQGEL